LEVRREGAARVRAGVDTPVVAGEEERALDGTPCLRRRRAAALRRGADAATPSPTL
jgi:hypothetical protein